MLFGSMDINAARAAVLLVIVGLAVREDMLRQRIPNVLTGVALAAGIGAACLTLSAREVIDSAKGALVGCAALMPFYLLRGMGAGDVKLMAAAGSFLGPRGALVGAAVALIAGLVLALLLVVWRLGESRPVLEATSPTERVNAGPITTLRGIRKERFPYALAIGVGVVGVLWWQGLLGALLAALGIGSAGDS